MNLLLDSHALLWALHDPDRLRPAAAQAIRDVHRIVFFSAASAWELELKAAKGKLVLPADWLDATATAGFLEIPVTAADGRHSARLPWHHSDPFDRVLLAQTRERGLHLVTRDAWMAVYSVPLMEA